MTRAAIPDELEPLRRLCRAGRLFEVQVWIEQGKPISLPKGSRARGGKRAPLRIAMESGFYSLVQVLLEAGVSPHEGNYDALEHAVSLRRPDLAALLLRYGARVDDVSMQLVIEKGQPEMIDFFLANGASLVRDSPIAWGHACRFSRTSEMSTT